MKPLLILFKTLLMLLTTLTVGCQQEMLPEERPTEITAPINTEPTAKPSSKSGTYVGALNLGLTEAGLTAEESEQILEGTSTLPFSQDIISIAYEGLQNQSLDSEALTGASAVIRKAMTNLKDISFMINSAVIQKTSFHFIKVASKEAAKKKLVDSASIKSFSKSVTSELTSSIATLAKDFSYVKNDDVLTATKGWGVPASSAFTEIKNDIGMAEDSWVSFYNEFADRVKS